MLDCDLYGYFSLLNAMIYNQCFPETCTESGVGCLWDSRTGHHSENWGEQRRGVERRQVLTPGCPCPLSNSLGAGGEECGSGTGSGLDAAVWALGIPFPTWLLLGMEEGRDLA